MASGNTLKAPGGRHTFAAVVTALAGASGSLASESLAAEAARADHPPLTERWIPPTGEVAPTEAGEFTARAIVEAARNSEARAWAELFARQRQAREERRAGERSARSEAALRREAAWESAKARQMEAVLGAAEGGEPLARLLAALGTGAQEAAARTALAGMDAMREIAVQNDRSLVDLISATAITSEERVAMAQLAVGAGSGVPMPPVRAPQGAKQGETPPGRVAETSPAPVVTQPDRWSAPDSGEGAAPRSAVPPGLGSIPEPPPASVSGADGLGVLAPLGEKVLGPVGGAAAERVIERVSARFPEVSRWMCKAGNAINRLIDGTLFCPSPGGPSGSVIFSPELAELARECQARENFELEENNRVCDIEAEAAKQRQAERDARYEASKAGQGTKP